MNTRVEMIKEKLLDMWDSFSGNYWLSAIAITILITGVVVIFAAVLATLITSDVSSSVSSYHDEKRGVTCWMYENGHNSSMACLPDFELKQQ